MKRSFALAGAFLIAPTMMTPTSVSADPVVAPPPVLVQPAPENLEVARSIVSISFPPERRQEMMDKVMGAVLQQMRAGMNLDSITDPGLRKILSDYLTSVPDLLRPATTAFLPKQMEAIATAYARMFTLQQLKDIEAFARTPSGMAFLQRNTEVLSDPAVAAVNSSYFREATEISERSSAQLKERVVAYIKAHPDALPKATPRK